MKKHKYKLRPGYGTQKLLIEFGPDSTNEQFVADLRAVLAGTDFKRLKKEDLFFNFITTFETPDGTLEIDHDEWGNVFAHAEDDQSAIFFLDGALLASGRFTKEDVNFEDYAKPITK